MRKKEERTTVNISPVVQRFNLELCNIAILPNQKVVIVFSNTHATMMDVTDPQNIMIGTASTPVMELDMNLDQLRIFRDAINIRIKAFERSGGATL